MFNIFIYKIFDVDTNHVNIPLEELPLALMSGTRNREFSFCQCKSILDVFKLQKEPSTQYKRFSQKGKLLLFRIIEIMLTLKLPTFPSNLTVQLLR